MDRLEACGRILDCPPVSDVPARNDHHRPLHTRHRQRSLDPDGNRKLSADFLLSITDASDKPLRLLLRFETPRLWGSQTARRRGDLRGSHCEDDDITWHTSY